MAVRHGLPSSFDRLDEKEKLSVMRRVTESTGGGDAPGRDAVKPSEIPRRGWIAIAKRVFSESNEDRVMTEAAGITFYALLSVFPALTAMVSLYGLFADRQSLNTHLADLSGVLPDGGMTIIKDQLERLLSSPQQSLGLGAAIGLGAALWSANQGTKAMMDALNIVYEEKEKRGFFHRTLLSLGMTFCALVFVLMALGALVVLPIVLNFVWLGDATEMLVSLIRWPVMMVGMTLILAALYRYGPSREAAKWRWVSYGGIFAALAWLGVSAGFTFYVGRFGNYDATYGSLGAVIGFMTWIWLSAIVVLIGAELNAEMEHQTARDSTTGPELPQGQRGAVMADTTADD
ncbi:YihY/virulence factor BrkB family protein [Acetobacteraceae bacterium H6797]|nr:YihY/virulence factor BrkB family protein [Acetobacteraceae bacterium H6797]